VAEARGKAGGRTGGRWRRGAELRLASIYFLEVWRGEGKKYFKCMTVVGVLVRRVGGCRGVVFKVGNFGAGN